MLRGQALARGQRVRQPRGGGLQGPPIHQLALRGPARPRRGAVPGPGASEGGGAGAGGGVRWPLGLGAGLIEAVQDLRVRDGGRRFVGRAGGGACKTGGQRRRRVTARHCKAVPCPHRNRAPSGTRQLPRHRPQCACDLSQHSPVSGTRFARISPDQ